MLSSLQGRRKPDPYGTMIAEFENQRRVWLLWPSRSDIWRNSGLPAQTQLRQLVGAVTRLQDVTMGVDPNSLNSAHALLPNNVKVVQLQYDDVWVRDTGPIFVRSEHGEVFGVDFSFNAWGGIYHPFNSDDELASRICDIEKIPYRTSRIVLVGGAVSTDGAGTIITTESCVLNPNRGLQGNREQFEEELEILLGAKKFIYLPSGLQHDETGGHVDQLCVFSGVGQVLLAWTDEPSINFHVCRSAYEILRKSRDVFGRKIDVIKVSLPPQIAMTEDEARGYTLRSNSLNRLAGDVFAASYVNFSFLNKGILLPQFGFSEQDEKTKEQFKSIFPDRTIGPVYCRVFVLGGGAIHCLTKEIFPT